MSEAVHGGLMRSPELAAFLNAIPFPFGIGYAWRRMWGSCLVSLIIRAVVGGVGAGVSGMAAFLSAFPDGGGFDTWAWVLIAIFGFTLPTVALLASSWDIYRRLSESDSDKPVAPIAIVLVLLTTVPFVPIIYNGLN